MATLLTLVARYDLIRVDPALGPRQLENRWVFLFPHVRDWFENTLPNLESTWDIETTPEQQVDSLLAVFCAGEVLTFGRHFKPLTHIQDGIWELKTADLRMFGWFPAKDHFICTDADTTDRVKTHGLYHGYKGQAVRYRDQIDLDDPKFIPGGNPDDVVSDFSYPE